MDITQAAGHVRARLGIPTSPAGARHPLGDAPVLLLLVGLPGTGKSYFAEAVRARHPVEVIRTDQVRKTLFERPTYEPRESGMVYLTCNQLVRDLLAEGHSVIFDGTNTSDSGRQRVYQVAEETGARLLVVNTTAPPAAVQQRLAARAAGAGPAYQSDASWPIYERMAPRLERIRCPHLVVDTSRDLGSALRVVDRLFAGQAIDDQLISLAAPAISHGPPTRVEEAPPIADEGRA